MQVNLLTYTPDPLRVMFVAARTCTSPDTPQEIWAETAEHERMLRAVRSCIVRNHNTVLRHANFTWAISGISRACANQLTRHSAGIAFDQQSLRYVSLDSEPEWVIPEHLDAQAKAGLLLHARRSWEGYRCHIDEGMAAEDARALLPLCTPTNLTCTANLAALLHLYRVRYQGTTGKPQGEIQRLTAEMVRCVVKADPWLAEFMPLDWEG